MKNKTTLLRPEQANLLINKTDFPQIIVDNNGVSIYVRDGVIRINGITPNWVTFRKGKVGYENC